MARNTNTNNTVKQAQQIINDVEATRSMRVDGQTVIAEITVRRDRDSDPVQFTAHIDFSDVTSNQILLWAARTKIIDLQRALRSCEQSFLTELAKRGPIIRRATEAGTGFTDPAKQQQRIMSAVQNMTAEERAALIKLLQSNV